jgi:FlaA1/EpsC-like NDP-sugar epimerase
MSYYNALISMSIITACSLCISSDIFLKKKNQQWSRKNMLLRDKIAIITGAGRGIGRETAINFAREGADVVLVSRSEKELSEVALEIKRQGQGSCSYR